MDHVHVPIISYNEIAQLYNDQFMNLELYDDTYDSFCNAIKNQPAKILDVRCGPGNITRSLIKRNSTFILEGIDIAENMIALARKNNPSAHFKVMDCRKITQLQGKYDGIVNGFCLPYIPKEDACNFITDCNHMLNANGILYISAIEGLYGQSKYELSNSGAFKMFVHYYEEKFFRQQFEAHNFKVVDFYRKKVLKTNGEESAQIIFIAQKV